MLDGSREWHAHETESQLQNKLCHFLAHQATRQTTKILPPNPHASCSVCAIKLPSTTVTGGSAEQLSIWALVASRPCRELVSQWPSAVEFNRGQCGQGDRVDKARPLGAPLQLQKGYDPAGLLQSGLRASGPKKETIGKIWVSASRGPPQKLRKKQPKIGKWPQNLIFEPVFLFFGYFFLFSGGR